MAALRGGEDALHPGEELRRLEDAGLLHGPGLHQPVVVELAEGGAHAVEAQAAGVVGGGDEAAAQGVHLRQGADHAGIAEVIGEFSAGEAGAGGRLHGDDAVIRLAPELFAHEGGDQAAQIAAAAGAADDDVGFDAVLIQRGLGLQADDALVQEHLVEHAAQHIAVAGVGGGHLDGLADGAAQGAGGAGKFREDFAAHAGGIRGGGHHGGAVGAHDLPAEGLLLVADLDHIDLAVQFKVGAGHGKGRAPLPGAGLGGDALEALLFGVIRLGDGGGELMAAGGVVALELVVDLSRCAQLLFEVVSTDEGRWTEHLVEVLYLLWDVDIRCSLVKLLLYQLIAENVAKLLSGAGLACCRIYQW